MIVTIKPLPQRMLIIYTQELKIFCHDSQNICQRFRFSRIVFKAILHIRGNE